MSRDKLFQEAEEVIPMSGFLSCIASAGRGVGFIKQDKEYVARPKLEPNRSLAEVTEVWEHMKTW